MRTAKVVVMPYDAAWKSDFEAIKCELEKALGNLAIGIEHVGSTSVEGLSAKPCIDIDVVIKNYSVFDAVVEKLKGIRCGFKSTSCPDQLAAALEKSTRNE